MKPFNEVIKNSSCKELVKIVRVFDDTAMLQFENGFLQLVYKSKLL